MDAELRTENGHENTSDLNHPCGTFPHRALPQSEYDPVRGRQRNAWTSDSNCCPEIGRGRPDRAARLTRLTGMMA